MIYKPKQVARVGFWPISLCTWNCNDGQCKFGRIAMGRFSPRVVKDLRNNPGESKHNHRGFLSLVSM